MSGSPTCAFVLAAGRATRLRPLTLSVAKPALSFVGEPILGRLLDRLAEAGVERAVVNLHHAASSIRRIVAARGSRAPAVTWSDETGQLLDTAGALMPVRDLLEGGPFYLLNGDCVHDVDLRALAEAHARSADAATLAVTSRVPAGFGVLQVDARGRVERFGGPAGGGSGDRHFLSVQVVSPQLLATLPEGPPRPLALFRDWYPDAARGGLRFGTFETRADWHAVDTPERYLEATRAYLAARGGGPFVHPGARVDPEARLGPGCAVHDGARVESGASLEDTVLLEGAHVGRGVRLERCLVGHACRIPAGEVHGGRLLVGGPEPSA